MTTITLDRLQSVILQQVIVTRRQLRPEVNFRNDLRYKASDLLEPARLIDGEFHLRLTTEQAGELATVDETIRLLNRMQRLIHLLV